jgi:plasmid maintenance system antidote protein VapI
MEEKIKHKIKESGYKKKYLAERLKISSNYLSMCIKGKRNLSEEKKIELNKLLTK